jgi:hypothetical protein
MKTFVKLESPCIKDVVHETYLEFYAEFKNEIKTYNDNNEDDGPNLFLDHSVGIHESIIKKFAR